MQKLSNIQQFLLLAFLRTFDMIKYYRHQNKKTAEYRVVPPICEKRYNPI